MNAVRSITTAAPTVTQAFNAQKNANVSVSIFFERKMQLKKKKNSNFLN